MIIAIGGMAGSVQCLLWMREPQEVCPAQVNGTCPIWDIVFP